MLSYVAKSRTYLGRPVERAGPVREGFVSPVIRRNIYHERPMSVQETALVAGCAACAFQMLDIGINIGLKLANLVYRPLRHDSEVFRVLRKNIRP